MDALLLLLKMLDHILVVALVDHMLWAPFLLAQSHQQFHSQR